MNRKTWVSTTLPLVVSALVVTGAQPAAASTDPVEEVAATVNTAVTDAVGETVAIAATEREGDALVATTSASPAEIAAAVTTAVEEAAQVAAEADLTPEQSALFTELVAEAAESEASATTVVELPMAATGSVSVDTSVSTGTEVSFGLPTTRTHEDAQVASDGTVLYADRSGTVDVAAQPGQDGSVRVNTVLNGPEAPTEFVYPLSLPHGVTPQPAADGGVDMIRSIAVTDPETGVTSVETIVVSRVAPAWAVDARGLAVPTHYEIRGGDLVQVVEHHVGDHTYPVTADPWWSTAWKIAKCAAAVVFVALTTVFVVGKAIKIVKAVSAARAWVRSVGGANEAAKLLVGASTSAERSRVLARARTIAGASVLDFFGITQIKEGCF
ncbi:hypothetical protein [Blastococcus sp. PRF04-17]|uniref:hypothetical protein n=1 Tax=Blastococcus sp. PRF04-17 TaxID=2933797 RepID=UPI001FF0FC0F|nr:hypothetical protein [Blastococcus sp. PRF04-17]UOY03040.1 hypothetical protein MVA48_06740 [Blastococcus sp. PRF04-17]